MTKRASRKQKKVKGGNAEEQAVEPMNNQTVGGRSRRSRKTRKTHKGKSTWIQFVTTVLHEMRKKNPATSLREAMIEASRRKKSGKM